MKDHAKKNKYVVIGDPIDHSLSPLVHNAGYSALGLPYEFCKEKVTAVQLENFISNCRIEGIPGMSCTMPHKVAVQKYLDVLDPVASAIGAVNTIVNRSGALCGYNTDYIGVVAPLEKLTNLKGKRVSILGSGGVSRAAVYGLSKAGAYINVYSHPFTELVVITDTDIIFNATPVGFGKNGGETPIPKEYLRKDHIVFDAIYDPAETQLIKDAREVGAQIILGTEMFLQQAFAQFELFTGIKAPEAEMRSVLNKKITI